MNRKLRKAVAGLMATAALAAYATHASAVTVSLDGGPAGSSASVTDSTAGYAWSFSFGQNYGWNHTINVHDLVVAGGTGNVSITAKQVATTDRLPAFTIWSRTSGSGLATGAHQFNQVLGPNDTHAPNINSFMGTAGVDHILGYGNAGAPFTNQAGNAIGHGNIFDANGGQTGTPANPHVAATGSTWSWGTDANGLAYVTLNFVGLQSGTYLIYSGGSDYNNTSGKTTGGLTLTATVVPVPAAVWLFGSALAGLVGWSRRRPQS